MKGSSFRNACVTKLHAREVIANENPAGLAVEPKEIRGARDIFGGDTSEGEVDRKALKGDGCCTGRMRTRGSFGLFGSNASGADIKDRIKMFEFGDTRDVFVGVVEVIVTWVTQALVPEKAFCFLTNGKNRRVVKKILAEGEAFKWDREVFEVGLKVVGGSATMNINSRDGVAFTIGKKGRVLRRNFGKRRGAMERKQEGKGVGFAI